MNGPLSVLLFAVLAAGSPQAGEQHVIDQTTLDQIVSRHVREESRDREDVREMLRRPELRRIAERLGISIELVDARVATLQGPELRELAAEARVVNEGLAGGSLKTRFAIGGIILFVIILILVSV